MAINYKEHWTKLNKQTEKYENVSKEEYERVVLPLAQEYINNPTDNENYDMLESAVDANATAMNLFLASAEELEQIKKHIMEDYRDQCIFKAECETGYQHWRETYIYNKKIGLDKSSPM